MHWPSLGLDLRIVYVFVVLPFPYLAVQWLQNIYKQQFLRLRRKYQETPSRLTIRNPVGAKIGPQMDQVAPKNFMLHLYGRASCWTICETHVASNWLPFPSLLVSLNRTFEPNVATHGPHHPIKLVQKVCRVLSEICHDLQGIVRTKCAHTTHRTETTDPSTQDLPNTRASGDCR